MNPALRSFQKLQQVKTQVTNTQNQVKKVQNKVQQQKGISV